MFKSYYIKLKEFSLLLFILSFHFNYAQLSKAEYYNKIDNKIFLLSKRPNLTIDSIVNYVNKNFTLAEDKVRAYYTYISLNIAYDVSRGRNKYQLYTFRGSCYELNPEQSPKVVFSKKKGVCHGISRLMERLCESSQIPCEMIIGYVFTGGKMNKKMLHTWNTVKLDSTWQLIDITWSNGYVDYTGTFVKQFSDKYFLSKPDFFIKNHLPEDPMWQLSTKPINKTYFDKTDTIINIYFSENFIFNDSISKFLKKDSIEQFKAQQLNYYAFEKHNGFLANIDVFLYFNGEYHYNNSKNLLEKYLKLSKTKILDKNNTIDNTNAIDILKEAKIEINLSSKYITDQKFYTKSLGGLPEKLRKKIVVLSEQINQNITLIKNKKN